MGWAGSFEDGRGCASGKGVQKWKKEREDGLRNACFPFLIGPFVEVRDRYQ